MTFFYGFLSGIGFMIVLCYIIAASSPSAVQRNTSKFFIELNARKRRKYIKQMNGK